MQRKQAANHLHSAFLEAGFSKADAEHYAQKMANVLTEEALVSERLYRNEIDNLIKGLQQSRDFSL